ncbi:MAG: YjjG family noncanonical pyrimidine nucleotidase [Acutalibacteraceae bacterium]
MIKFVFLDLDDTILDFHKAESHALTKMLETIGVTPTEQIIKRYSEINLSQWKRLERGEITREQVKVGRYKLLFDELGVEQDPKAATAIYERYLGQGHWFIDGAQQLLCDLHGKYRLFVASNGTLNVQTGRIKSAGLKNYIEQFFISEQIGANKPDKAFFDKAFSQIPDFDKKYAVIVGDSLTSDILGGINAGIKTVWFNQHRAVNGSKFTPDYEIHTLSELPALLDNM